MRLRYTDRAQEDVQLAFTWYEKQRTGLGFEFLDCLEVAIENVSHQPEMYQIVYANFRSCVIRRFPFFSVLHDRTGRGGCALRV
jgi:toxin ParE1/3/4